MADCWKVFTLLCAVFPFATSSLQLSSWQCGRRDEADWAGFQTAIQSSGLAGEDGLSKMAADLRTGALSNPEPHTCVIVGGGEWGPRVVARAVLESVNVDWVNDVYLLDMKDAKSFLDQDSDIEQARTWLNQHLCDAISRCPQKAVVVLDNTHVLQGEDIRLLDTMLSLLDGAKSNMECDGEKISGDRCLFLLLLNEDGSEEAKRLSGKDRLLKTWEFKGLEFTTKAFVGRVDTAVSLSRRPQILPEGMEADWSKARSLPKNGLRALAARAWETADRGTIQAVGVAAALGVAAATVTMLATFYTSGQCGTTSSSSRQACDADTAATTTVGQGSGNNSPGGEARREDGEKSKKKKSRKGDGRSGDRQKAVDSRGGGPGGSPVNRGQGAVAVEVPDAGSDADEAVGHRTRSRRQSAITGTSNS